jgi:hypothetical protein
MKLPLALLAVVAVTGLLAVRLASLTANSPAAVGDLSSTLAIMAPGTTAGLVQVTYTGLTGKCKGQTYKPKTNTIPAGSSILLSPGPAGDEVLPEDCVASAAIDAIRGDVLAMVVSHDGTVRRAPTRLAAYVAGTVGARAGARVAIPRISRQAGNAQFTSRILVTNAGTVATDAVLSLVDGRGRPISPTACAECTLKLQPGETGIWDAAQIGVLAGIATTSGLVVAAQPLAVMVEEADAAGRLDLAQYTGVGAPGQAVPVFLARLLRFADSGALGTGDSLVAVQNLNPTDNTTVALQLDPHGGGAPSLVDLPNIQPGASFQLPLAGAPIVPNGSFGGAVMADKTVAALGRTEWAKTSGLAIDGARLGGADLVVPLVAKRWLGQSSLLTVYNTDLQARAPIVVEINRTGDSTPLLTHQAVISPRRAVVLDLAGDKAFDALPANFTGSLHLRSQGTVVVQAALIGEAAVAASEGMDAATAGLAVHAPLVYAGPAPEQPTPTDTPTATPTATDTPTPRISLTPTPTVIVQQTDTPTPTSEVRDTDTPTATNTRTGPRTATPTPERTRPPTKRRWTKETAGNSGQPGDPVGRVEAPKSPKGVWWKNGEWVQSPEGREYNGLDDAVEDNWQRILNGGTLKDFWAVDSPRIRVGPRIYDTRTGIWTDLAKDETQPGGGQIRFDQRVVIDPDGNSAVPFQVSTECPLPTGCDDAGVRGYGLDGGVKYDLRFGQQPEAGSLGVEVVHMVPGIGSGTFALPSGRSAAPAQAGQPYAVSQGALYVLPNSTAVPYPHLEEPPAGSGTLRNAGFASAATLRPDGRLLVFTWVEQHAPPPSRDVTYNVYANTWTGSGWEVDDLTSSPLFNGDARDDRVTAATYCGDGTLWASSAAGTLAGRHADSTWELAVPDPGISFTDISDAACDVEGTLWMATEDGLLKGTLGVPFPVFAPIVQKP